MAINRKTSVIKKQETAKEETKVTYQVKVTRAKDIESAIMFDMDVNGVKIYGCSYKELQRKDGSGSFYKIDLPQRKGSDGKWYSVAWFKITEDIQEIIEKQIEDLINKD